jgi:hypothetical protein
MLELSRVLSCTVLVCHGWRSVQTAEEVTIALSRTNVRDLQLAGYCDRL